MAPWQGYKSHTPSSIDRNWVVLGYRNRTDSLRRVRTVALDVLSFGSFRARHNIEHDSLTFVQRLKTSPCNRRMMHKHIRPPFLHDEAEPMLVIEPFYFATGHNNTLPRL